MSDEKQLTIILPGGRLPAGLATLVADLQNRYGVEAYLTTTQNLRLRRIPAPVLEEVRAALMEAGADIKGPGRFPKPRVCVGLPDCKLALVDPRELADAIWDRYGKRNGIKPKLKLGIAGCPASCSNATLADIGIVATRKGFDLYAGGKGGARPLAGRRLARGLDLAAVVGVVGRLMDYHQAHTTKKQRMVTLMDREDFPVFQEGMNGGKS